MNEPAPSHTPSSAPAAHRWLPTAEDPEGHLQIYARDDRLPADAPLIRIGRGEADLYRDAARLGHLHCAVPGCQHTELIVRGTARTRDHFAHKSGGEHARESLAHAHSARAFADLYRTAPGATVTLERTLPGGARRADVGVELGETLLGIEIQAYDMQPHEFATRRGDYAAAGVNDLWAFLLHTRHAQPVQARRGATLPPDAAGVVSIGELAQSHLEETGALLVFDPASDLLGVVFAGVNDTEPSALIPHTKLRAGRRNVTPRWFPLAEATVNAQLRMQHPVLDELRDALRTKRAEARREDAERIRRKEDAARRRAQAEAEDRYLREKAPGHELIERGEMELFVEVLEEAAAEEVRRANITAEERWVADRMQEMYQARASDYRMRSLAGRMLGLGSTPSGPLVLNATDMAMDPALVAARLIRLIRSGVNGKAALIRRFIDENYMNYPHDPNLARRRLSPRIVRNPERKVLGQGVIFALLDMHELGVISWPESRGTYGRATIPNSGITWRGVPAASATQIVS